MKMSDFAELAASDNKNIPTIIKMLAESMENTDSRLQNIENAIRELAPKIGTMTTQLTDTVANSNRLKKQIAESREDTAVLKTWLNDMSMAKVAEIDSNSDMVLVKKKNDGMLPNDRKSQQETTIINSLKEEQQQAKK
ncbi:MAG: hypothetical protein H8D97_00265 [Proteobacteria bacterium]|nr:hypothetical protein [Pseudomonadota bacterium]